MKIAMIGTGYVGLVSGSCFSEFGVAVTCVDRDHQKIAALLAGKMPIYEPGLESLVARNLAADKLRFTTDLRPAVADADAVFIAVGTPSRRGDGHADLQYVYAAAKEIALSLTGYTVIVTKSTVPVGTGREVGRIIAETLANRADGGKGVTFDIVSNPEFLREGSAIDDFMRPDRVVIGVSSDAAKAVMQELYRPLFLLETPMVVTSIETSELIKYAANGFLATKITFINEIADLCESLGCDVQAVAQGIGLDGRIGKKFLHAGPGYGGSCFPKDVQALIQTAADAKAPLQIMAAVDRVNQQRKASLGQRVIDAMGGGTVKGKTIAVLGVAFKPNTDDMREAPSLDLIPALQAAGATVRAFDPEAMVEAAKLLPMVEWCKDEYDAMNSADALVILTEWNRFRALNLVKVRSSLKQPLMIDLRNIYQPLAMAAAGFKYVSIGRPQVKS
ncbi:MAG: UDP-glucose/GDP-mannose dehydrogenase family protein [Candidatus Pacebacteria bacterium]|nr:UDP-glucose/GDP-mannose dehydrogenase family protein [Candidatus Paceibacterota bacterium]